MTDLADNAHFRERTLMPERRFPAVDEGAGHRLCTSKLLKTKD